MRRAVLLLLLGGLILQGCGSADVPTTEPTVMTTAEPTLPPEITIPTTTLPAETEPPETTLPPDPVLERMEEMSLRQLVGQLFIVAPEALTPGRWHVTGVDGDLLENLERYPVGGIILFGDNIDSPEQVRSFTCQLQEASDIPLFLAVDEEGGPVARLANSGGFDLPRYHSAAAVGREGALAAVQMGLTIGGYLKEYGFNLNFAPVADVFTNPDNRVIGNRAFSADPVTVAHMADGVARGLRHQGIIPTFKHFPGHGDTTEDSHYGIAVSHKTAEEMRTCEWLPFEKAGELDCVMVGHIAVPAITGDLTPATLSDAVVTGVLREELGFEGLIITDSMAMGAITEGWSSGEAALAALRAGCDLILMPEDLPEAFEAVVQAVEDGTLPLTWLTERVERILRFKTAHGLWGT